MDWQDCGERVCFVLGNHCQWDFFEVAGKHVSDYVNCSIVKTEVKQCRFFTF